MDKYLILTQAANGKAVAFRSDMILRIYEPDSQEKNDLLSQAAAKRCNSAVRIKESDGEGGYEDLYVTQDVETVIMQLAAAQGA